MMDIIDNFLNKITMYRLVLYYLILLLLAAVIFSLFGIIHYSALSIIASSFFLTAVCWIINWVFAKAFGAQTNVESVYITALILALIIAPPKTLHDLLFLFWVGALAMASKYILAIGNKHLFNPTALAAVITAFALGQSAVWWVSRDSMLPLVLLGGILIVRKIRRFNLVFYFLLTALATSFAFAVLKGSNLTTVMRQAFIDSPLLFFAFVMLTEPLTTPPTKRLQIYYGAIVGFLFAPQVHVAGIYSTPELALVVGNVFSYLVSPKEKLLLVLREKLKISPTIYDFVFESNRSMAFRPGQYLEWTLGHKHADSRGNRRYFTIASAPTEKEIRMGVKFYEEPSSFKKTLEGFRPGSTIVAGQLAGDFVLPEDQHKKLVFIAGGIGVTPFRSMIKYLIDTKQKRDIVLFYSNKEVGDVVYTDVFEEAAEKNGLKTVYTLTDRGQVPPNWQGQIGMVNEQMIKAHVPDYKDRLFYISGPRGMITAFEDVLAEMGISRSQIKVDFFPGFA